MNSLFIGVSNNVEIDSILFQNISIYCENITTKQNVAVLISRSMGPGTIKNIKMDIYGKIDDD